ncbi:hypothetical protein T4D_7530 [Trichinella pseudospiralis]|uniref:Uncharacterized protein n=1 Tax=Trichinella pseudospiralis TaxID=6337 RepID=A0A0V1FWR6_TRIPS|nr:hypothetical protein T4D_7530 [Trichinella pseudospiralis]
MHLRNEAGQRVVTYSRAAKEEDVVVESACCANSFSPLLDTRFASRGENCTNHIDRCSANGGAVVNVTTTKDKKKYSIYCHYRTAFILIC